MLRDVVLNQIPLCAGKLGTVSEERIYLHGIRKSPCNQSVKSVLLSIHVVFLQSLQRNMQ